MHNAFIFPGQGSQFVGMGKDLYDNYKIAREIYNLSSEILDFKIKDISFYGPEYKILKTEYTQPIIFVHSVITDILLKENGITPTAVSGHSLGEISALVSANIIALEDALKIVKVRSIEMSKANKINNGSMAAILGANKEQIEIICNQKSLVVAANTNSNDQVVISGYNDGINDAITTAKKLGIKRAIKLNVSGAFHSPLMKSARLALTKIVKSIKFNHSDIQIFQNYTGNKESDPKNIKNNLIKQLENPVLWLDTILNMKNSKFNRFIEVGPGSVLKNLNKRICSDLITLNFNNLNQLETNEIN